MLPFPKEGDRLPLDPVKPHAKAPCGRTEERHLPPKQETSHARRLFPTTCQGEQYKSKIHANEHAYTPEPNKSPHTTTSSSAAKFNPSRHFSLHALPLIYGRFVKVERRQQLHYFFTIPQFSVSGCSDEFTPSLLQRKDSQCGTRDARMHP